MERFGTLWNVMEHFGNCIVEWEKEKREEGTFWKEERKKEIRGKEGRKEERKEYLHSCLCIYITDM